MNWQGLVFAALDGLASASGLFFVAAGLSLIFGVTRIINIAHGSFYMLGTYIAVTLATSIGGGFGFWGGIVATALIVGVIGAAIEIVLLRPSCFSCSPPLRWCWSSTTWRCGSGDRRICSGRARRGCVAP